MSLGPLELLLIVAVIALLFGAKKLPELMKGMGKGVREFKAEVGDLHRTDHPDGVMPVTVSLPERAAEPAVLAEPRRSDVTAQPSATQPSAVQPTAAQLGDRR